MKKISVLFLVLTINLSGVLVFDLKTAEAATAPAFQTVTTNIVSSAPSIACNKPTGTVENELLLAFVTAYQSDTRTISAPVGWSTLRGPDRNTGAEKIASYVFYKVAGASEGASYTFTFDSSGIYGDCAILRYSGVDTANPVDTASSGNNGTAATRTGTGITTSYNDMTLVLHSAGYNEAISTGPASMTERVLWDATLAVYDETISTAGATGDRTHTQTGVSSWVTQMVALKAPSDAVSTSGRIIRLRGRVLLHGNVRL